MQETNAGRFQEIGLISYNKVESEAKGGNTFY